MPSSVIRAVTYDEQSHTLRILYMSGLEYAYKNVPEEVYVAMKNAFSKGALLNKYIKGKYEFKRVGT